MRLTFSSLAPALIILTALSPLATARADDPWVVYEGKDGPGNGKHVVLVSGDEEYRSEEALPQLGRILADQHGFRCTVLFAIDPETGLINPEVNNNIPGLQALETADLMIIFTRFRALPDEQMQYVDAYLRSGRPVVGMRTATHAFNFPGGGNWSHYGNGYGGDRSVWRDGFGRLVLGEKWISHHGNHKQQSTRGRIVKSTADHPILRGIADGDVWGPTDVYGVRLPLPGDTQVLLLGESIARAGEYDDSDPLYGMRSTDSEPAAKAGRSGYDPNDPMMPAAWTKTYQVPDGKPGRAFVSTMGASTDLLNEPMRRLFVNGAYWALGLEDRIPSEGTRVDLVGDYRPTAFAFRKGDYWTKKNLQISDFRAAD